jgi:hypothetical protein
MIDDGKVCLNLSKRHYNSSLGVRSLINPVEIIKEKVTSLYKNSDELVVEEKITNRYNRTSFSSSMIRMVRRKLQSLSKFRQLRMAITAQRSPSSFAKGMMMKWSLTRPQPPEGE